MSKKFKEIKVQSALMRCAAADIPEDLDLWPIIETHLSSRLPLLNSTVQFPPVTYANPVKRPHRRNYRHLVFASATLMLLLLAVGFLAWEYLPINRVDHLIASTAPVPTPSLIPAVVIPTRNPVDLTPAERLKSSLDIMASSDKIHLTDTLIITNSHLSGNTEMYKGDINFKLGAEHMFQEFSLNDAGKIITGTDEIIFARNKCVDISPFGHTFWRTAECRPFLTFLADTRQTKNITDLGKLDLAGQQVYHLQGEIVAVANGGLEVNNKFDFYIGVNDNFLYRLVSTLNSSNTSQGSQSISSDMSFSKLATPVLINLPPVIGDKGLAVSPDQHLVAFSKDKNIVQIWDIGKDARNGANARGKLLSTLIGHTGMIISLDFNPTADRLVTASMDGSVRVWDVPTGKQLFTISDHHGENIVVKAIFSPDGQQLATLTTDGSIRIWHATTGSLITLLGDTHGSGAKDVIFSPDNLLVTDGASVWEISTGKLLYSSTSSYPDSFGFNGKLLVITIDNNVTILNISDGTSRPVKIARNPTSILVNHDGSEIFINQNTAVSGSSMLYLWNTTTEQQIGAFQSSFAFDDAIFSHDGQILFSSYRHYDQPGQVNVYIKRWQNVKGEDFLAILPDN